MYRCHHFTADTSRLNDQVGTVGGQMEIRMQVSWMSDPHMHLGITHTHGHCTLTSATRGLKPLNGLYGFGKLQFLFL